MGKDVFPRSLPGLRYSEAAQPLPFQPEIDVGEAASGDELLDDEALVLDVERRQRGNCGDLNATAF